MMHTLHQVDGSSRLDLARDAMNPDVTLKRIPILTISDVMNKIRATDPMKMVWHRGKILSPTLPSSSMTF